MKNKLLCILSIAFISGFAGAGFAQMESGNYCMAGSVFSAGGEPVASDNYGINATLGQPSPLSPLMEGYTNLPSSENYHHYPGFWFASGAPECGNGIIEPGEQCDDGNTADGDGCSSQCEVETNQPAEVTVSANGNGTYNYSVVDSGTEQPVIDIQSNNGLINLAGFNYSFDGNPSDGVIGISIKNLEMSPGVTKTVTVPYLPYICAVDSDEFLVGNLNTYTKENWQACIDNPNAVGWAWWAAESECGEYGDPVYAVNKSRETIYKYTCEKTLDGLYAKLSGFDHTTIIGVVDPTLITLSSFTASPSNKEVIVKWTTESEIDNAGFNLYRAESETGAYTKINNVLISAKGSSTQGASYEFVDKAVQNRKTYYYNLEDIDLSGKSTIHGPVSATPRLIFGLGK